MRKLTLVEIQETLSEEFDDSGRLPTNLKAWTIDRRRRVWIGIPQTLKNKWWWAKKEKVSLGDTTMTGYLAVVDETGSALEPQLVEYKKKPGFYELFIKLDEPWKRGIEKTFYRFQQKDRRGSSLSRNFLGQYSLSMQQKYGREGIQYLALIVPKDWKLAVASRDPDHVEKIGDFTVNIWAKRVKRNENHKVDVLLLRNR